IEVVEGAFKSELENTVIVTHGNLMALLLNHYNKQFGFNEWANLSNPDIYLLKSDSNRVTFERLWNKVTEYKQYCCVPRKKSPRNMWLNLYYDRLQLQNKSWATNGRYSGVRIFNLPIILNVQLPHNNRF